MQRIRKPAAGPRTGLCFAKLVGKSSVNLRRFGVHKPELLPSKIQSSYLYVLSNLQTAISLCCVSRCASSSLRLSPIQTKQFFNDDIQRVLQSLAAKTPVVSSFYRPEYPRCVPTAPAALKNWVLPPMQVFRSLQLKQQVGSGNSATV